MSDATELMPEGLEQEIQTQYEHLNEVDDQDFLAQAARAYLLWWYWADFELTIITPIYDEIAPPKIILPEKITSSNEMEFVYPIHDWGYKLSTSKGSDMYLSGMSMCKLYFTIEKMIYLLVERLKSGGVSTETEVQIAFGGHELAQRKAFESIINLIYNVVVTNFDPGAWGERYLQIVKRLSDKGYGYPPAAPRENFRVSHAASSQAKKR
jgi:hypothetical protein